MDNVIGLRIKELRLKKGQTQEDLGNLLHVKKQTISKYENGINIPDADMLKQLSDILECSSDYLIGKTDNPDAKIYQTKEVKIEIEKNYPFDLSPEQVEKLVNRLKEYRFDVEGLIQEIKKGNEPNEL